MSSPVTIRITRAPEVHHLKPEYLQKYCDIHTFVETGTYRGDAIQLALDNGYKQVFSCDINEQLWELASARFEDQPVTVELLDSVDFLDDVLSDKINPNDPITFWLDAHRSGPLIGSAVYGDCPINHELDKIADLCKRNDHTIFIDNKSLYGCEEWGFVQLQDTLDRLHSINPDYKILFLEGVRPEDIICATTKTI
jgi:hypothetical protein